MARAKAIYFINQFFAGVGGEDKADFALDMRPAALGPAKRFQELCGDSLEIVATVYCGDNYFADHPSAAAEAVIEAARANGATMFVAGPAFGSGRYGYACAELCHQVTAALGISCLSAMAPENPAVEFYQQ
jgi:glycine reductase